MHAWRNKADQGVAMLKRNWVWLLLLGGLSAVSARADSHAAIEQACTDLVLDYAYYRDRPDAVPAALAGATLALIGAGIERAGTGFRWP